MARKRTRTREQEAVRSRLYLALWKPEDRRAGDGAFGLIFYTQNGLFFLCSHSHPSRKLQAPFSFLPPPSLPFLFLKKIAAWQKGPSCGGLWPPSGLSKGPWSSEPLPRKAGRQMSKFSNC